MRKCKADICKLTADFDTNNDGIVDITDAANVLVYYSQCGAGLTNLSFSDWMKSR